MSVLTIVEAARRIATGALDPVALTETAIAAATETGQAFIATTFERARHEAEQARQRWRNGVPLSPWDGIPLSWKDLFDVQGTVTTAGSALRRNAPPAQFDAPILAHAAQAGFVIVGKTNLSEFAFSGLGLNPCFGTPPGPGGRADRVPGGSSSGAAVAVTNGAGLAAIGTDTAGSVRIPSAFHGLVGFRPSVGRYNTAGVFALAPSFDVPGPIAWSVADCIVLDAVLRGSRDIGQVLDIDPSRLRLVADRNLFLQPHVEAAVRENAEAWLGRLQRLGAEVEVREIKALREAERILDMQGWLGALEAVAEHAGWLDNPTARALVDPRIVARLDKARLLPPDRAIILARSRDRLARDIKAELDGALLAVPTVAHVAPAIASTATDEGFAAINLATLRTTMLTSFLLMPGLALPTGADIEGLPTSIMVSAPSGEDESLLAAGSVIDLALRSWA